MAEPGDSGQSKKPPGSPVEKTAVAEKGPAADPCGVCNSCKEIKSGIGLDVMEIDGANASGGVKYHLFRRDMDQEWVPLTSGRKAEYDQAIERLIGTLPLFLRRGNGLLLLDEMVL